MLRLSTRGACAAAAAAPRASLHVSAAAGATDRTLNMKTTIKGAFARRKPGLSMMKGRKPKVTLDTKHAPKGYYKGNSVGVQGRRTAIGGFIKEEWRSPDFVAPAGLATTQLKPYVAKSVKPVRVAPPSALDFLSDAARQQITADEDVAAALSELRALKGDAYVELLLKDHTEPELPAPAVAAAASASKAVPATSK